jgi:hypothetical protein
MLCPICEAENPDDLPECATCGGVLHAAASRAGQAVTPIEGLEPTQLAPDDLAVPIESMPDVEHTRLDDFAERTPAPPETATCSWCGTPSLGAVCDSCGRRKSRYVAPAVKEERRAATGEIVTCPSCFARVAREVRCSDCGVPFPLQEL